MTNYDCIRSISVEEMADKLEYFNNYMNTALDLYAASGFDLNVKEFIKQWLLQEVRENEETNR